MATTYDKIQSTTLSSAASSIDFTSIPSTYTDLRVTLTCTGTTYIYPAARVNSSASLYSLTTLEGNGTAISSSRAPGSEISLASLGTETVVVLYTLDIFSYAGSTYKTILTTSQENHSSPSGKIVRTVHLWRSTAAITSVNLLGINGNFATGTSATLYGIKAA
jgi:hypothetical protein